MLQAISQAAVEIDFILHLYSFILLAHLRQSAVLSRTTTSLQKIRPDPDAEH